MKKIWLKTAVPEDFEEAEIGDWIEGVGALTTHWEKHFIRRYGAGLVRRKSLGIMQKHHFDNREGDISNAAWRFAVKQGAEENELAEGKE